MRTFEAIQENLRANKTYIMHSAMSKLSKGGLKEWEEKAQNMIVEECQRNLENIGEVTTIEIGANTNAIIESVQKAYQLHTIDYWKNFEKFITDYVSGLSSEGKPVNGIYFSQSECLELGVSLNDLLCFKGKNPMNEEVGDLFRQEVNVSYGTNIPMSSVEKQALQDYEAVAFGDDEVAKAKAYMHLKEVQRDAGKLKNGGIYYTLANDLEYQKAQDLCSGRNL